jgi:hypothetical protein
MAKLLTGDLHWAADNVAGKIVGGSSGQNWGAYAAEMLRQHGLARETLSEAAMRLGYSKLSNWDEAVDTVFEDLFLHRLAPVISAEQIDRESSSICTSKAVVRWIAGQASLFFRFPHLPETEIAHERIAGIIGGVEAEISAEDIATTRQVFITTWNSCGQTVILTSMMR